MFKVSHRPHLLEKAVQYVQAAAPDLIGSLPPLERMRVLLPVAQIALIAPIAAYSETTADFLQAYMKNQAKSEGAQSALQVDSLSAILALWTHYISREPLAAALPYLLDIISQHFFEKISDDLAMSDGRSGFTLGDTIKRFNAHCIALIDGKCSLEAAMQNVTQGLDLTHLTTQLTGVINTLRRSHIKVLANMIADNRQADRKMLEVVAFFDDANRSFLDINFLVTRQAAQALDDLKAHLHPALIPLADFGKSGLRNRYVASNRVLESPAMPIEEAHLLGQQTILTDYTYATALLAMAKADPAVGEQMAEHVELISAAIIEASTMIRDLNDAGPLLIDMPHTFETLAQIHSLFPKLPPRVTFRTFADYAADQPALQEALHLFSRPIKDSIEREYNMTLDAGMTWVEADDQWTQYMHNLTYVSHEFRAAKERLAQHLDTLARVAPQAAYVIGSFVYFNDELYSQQTGDYDTQFRWTHLRSMQDAEAWRCYFDIQ